MNGANYDSDEKSALTKNSVSLPKPIVKRKLYSTFAEVVWSGSDYFCESEYSCLVVRVTRGS